MAVPHDCGGLVGERAAGTHDPHEHVEVLTTTRRRSGSEGLVEAAETDDQITVDGKVGTGAEHTRVEREEGRVSGPRREIEEPWPQGLRPRHALVEVALGGRVETCRRHEAGHAAHFGVAPEAPGDTVQPPRV